PFRRSTAAKARTVLTFSDPQSKRSNSRQALNLLALFGTPVAQCDKPAVGRREFQGDVAGH
ncbi:MAG: hypothetical protein MI924_20195, partial [Chloroflexales bacterium]|nr:hypothetical protein [Chloroflexales bacterium]